MPFILRGDGLVYVLANDSLESEPSSGDVMSYKLIGASFIFTVLSMDKLWTLPKRNGYMYKKYALFDHLDEAYIVEGAKEKDTQDWLYSKSGNPGTHTCARILLHAEANVIIVRCVTPYLEYGGASSVWEMIYRIN